MAFSTILEVVNVDVTSIFPAQCVDPSRSNLYYQRLCFQCATPVVGCAICYVVYCFKLRNADDQLALKGTCNRARCLAPTPSIATDSFVHTDVNLMLLITFVLYVPTSSAVFGFFSQHVLDDGSCYLYADYSTNCNSDVYETWTIFAVTMVFVYPIGIPMTYLVIMWLELDSVDPVIDDQTGKKGRMDESVDEAQLACRIREDDASVKHLDFLFGAYECEFWWWEIFECGRRLLLTSANVFISRAGIELQLIVNICFALFSMKLYSYYAPYLEDADDVLAEVAQWVIIFTLISALLIVLGIGVNSDGEFTIVGMIFIFLQLICTATVLVLVLSDTVKERDYIKSQVSEAANAGRRLSRQMTMRKKAAVPIMAVVKMQALARGALARRQEGLSATGEARTGTAVSIRLDRAELESKTNGPRRSFKDITEGTYMYTYNGVGQADKERKGVTGVPNKRPSVVTRPQPFALGYDREQTARTGQPAGIGSAL